ncbi:hypothetical protein HMPREF0239_02377, partial [Clostridium sp. ATCC BAA-442]
PYLLSNRALKFEKMIYKKQRAGLLVLSTIRPALFVARGVQKGHFQFASEKDDIARQLYSYCQKGHTLFRPIC